MYICMYVSKFTKKCHSQTILFSERRQGQETFSAPSAEKQTENCDTVFKPPSLSITLRYWD